MIWRLHFELPGSLEYVGCLRKSVACFLECSGVAREAVFEVEVLLGELANNAVMHGQGSGYTVEVEFHGSHVVVIVSDQGAGFSGEEDLLSPGTLRPVSKFCHEPAEEERFGGWGLLLVRSLCERVEILPGKPQGTIIRAEKHIDKREIDQPCSGSHAEIATLKCIG